MYVEFVKEQLSFQQRMAKRYAGSPHRVSLHLATAAKFEEILTLLQSLREKPAEPNSEQLSRAPLQRRQIMLSLDDLKDLPDALLDELNLSDSDKQDLLVESIVNDAGGVLSLDKIIVELYRRSGLINKRQIMISRLYRMVQRGLLYSLPTKRGVYSTYELSPQDVKRLFGQLDADQDAASGDSGPISITS
jgi:hypothetical protein